MTQLAVYPENNATKPTLQTSDFNDIQKALGEAGVRITRWQANRPITAESTSEEILAAYQEEIDALVKEGGYQSWDVVSMSPTHPDKAAFRQKFLAEHTHSEDEIRFFVRGQGLFTLHIGDNVYAVL